MRAPVHVPALAPLAGLFGWLVRARNRYWDSPGRAQHAGVPVVSVGNLTVGGTGKTPFVAWLAQRLWKEGRSPAIASRGYGGTAGRGPRVVSRGRGPEVVWREAGDEPFLLARLLPAVPVIVGSDRVAAARHTVALGARVVVLDDGFQHRRLARDVDIVLLDAELPLGGGGRLLPAGSLREPPSSLARADVVVATRCPTEAGRAQVERLVREWNLRAPVFRATHRLAGFVDSGGESVPAPSRAVAFSGIASPRSFFSSLVGAGVEVVVEEPYPDHHDFTSADWSHLAALSQRHQATLVTTEKDLVRLPHAVPGNSSTPSRPSAIALRIEMEVADGDALLAHVLGGLRIGHP